MCSVACRPFCPLWGCSSLLQVGSWGDLPRLFDENAAVSQGEGPRNQVVQVERAMNVSLVPEDSPKPGGSLQLSESESVS